jgi:hypothetical protein
MIKKFPLMLEVLLPSIDASLASINNTVKADKKRDC